VAPHIRSHRALCSCFLKKVSLQLSSEQSVGDVRLSGTGSESHGRGPAAAEVGVCRYNLDTSWSETGDRYLLKLFRDYVFHQVNADGSAWLDMAHVVHCLNKVTATHTPAHLVTQSGWRRGVVVSGVLRMNEVNACRARLVPGWVTIFGRVYHLGM